MTDVEQRLKALLDKWLASLMAHLDYASLDEDSYWKVQAWPPHERPNRWVIELALTRTRELAEEAARRVDAADPRFAEALETMAFLANLVGVDHIARSIPLAEPRREATASAETALGDRPSPTAAAAPSGLDATREMPAPSLLGDEELMVESVVAPASGHPGTHDTREMPSLRNAPVEPPPAGEPVTDPGTLPPLFDSQLPRREAPTGARAAMDERTAIVIADAVRLRKWGREWHELSSTIARMAGRPPIEEIRRILRTHKDEIDAGASGPRPSGA